MIYKESLTEKKNNYKLSFPNKNNDDQMIYLIVNPLQPNADFDMKFSSAFVSDTVFWVFVGIAIGFCLILVICGRMMCKVNPSLASQDAN